VTAGVTLLWTRQTGTAAADAAYGVAINTADSNVFVAGNSQGALNGQAYAGILAIAFHF
jgi:hypothetical protein